MRDPASQAWSLMFLFKKKIILCCSRRFRDLRVRPAERDRALNYDDCGGDGNVVIDIVLRAGSAFGTGEHATTQLCLEFLRERELEGARCEAIRGLKTRRKRDREMCACVICLGFGGERRTQISITGVKRNESSDAGAVDCLPSCSRSKG